MRRDIPAKFSLSELLADLPDEGAPADPGEDFMTAREWACYWECGTTKAREVLRRLNAAGRVEVGRRQVTGVNRNRCTVPVYRILTKEES